MNIKEAASKGISKLRLPGWNKQAFLEIHLVDGGGYGPWVTLYDVGNISQKMLVTYADCDDFEEYKEAPHDG